MRALSSHASVSQDLASGRHNYPSKSIGVVEHSVLDKYKFWEDENQIRQDLIFPWSTTMQQSTLQIQPQIRSEVADFRFLG